jgi:SAM-dependent methyltransferase
MTYESDILRDWYLLFHYGSPAEILDGVGFDGSGLPPRCLDFPVATVEIAGIKRPIGRALDVGCAVGRSAFELSKIADEVIGIDFSRSFVEAAESLGRGAEIPYFRYAEMHLPEPLVARLPAGVRPESVRFETGDAMDLRTDLGSFDFVHAANLLCRLPEPRRFLARLPALVSPGGTLVLATPATWMDAYTPSENQPRGLTLDYLEEHLGGAFERRSVTELPFLIREHRRKLQLSTSQTSVWVKC